MSKENMSNGRKGFESGGGKNCLRWWRSGATGSMRRCVRSTMREIA